MPSPDPSGKREGRRTLAANALPLCALAARGLGWRPGEFWQATPAELAACLADPATTPVPIGRKDLNRMLEREADG